MIPDGEVFPTMFKDIREMKLKWINTLQIELNIDDAHATKWESNLQRSWPR